MDRERNAAYWEANAATWTELSRAGYDVYRDHNNTPGFLAMLPPVDGLSGLDIGCGEGANTRTVARLGARMHAIDVAPTFIAHARASEQNEGVDTKGAFWKPWRRSRSCMRSESARWITYAVAPVRKSLVRVHVYRELRLAMDLRSDRRRRVSALFGMALRQSRPVDVLARVCRGRTGCEQHVRGDRPAEPDKCGRFDFATAFGSPLDERSRHEWRLRKPTAFCATAACLQYFHVASACFSSRTTAVNGHRSAARA